MVVTTAFSCVTLIYFFLKEMVQRTCSWESNYKCILSTFFLTFFFFERHNFEASFWQENGIQSNWDKLHMKLIQVAILLHIRHFLEEVNSFSLRSINFLLTDIFFFLPSSSGAEVLFVFVFVSSSQNPLGRAWRTTYNLINSSLGFPECP